MEVRPNPEGGHQKVKVKVRVNPNGIFNVVSASLIEKQVGFYMIWFLDINFNFFEETLVLLGMWDP